MKSLCRHLRRVCRADSQRRAAPSAQRWLHVPIVAVVALTLWGASAPRAVAAGRDNKAPTVSITSPASGTTYTTAQTVTVSASASDNLGVAKVEFYRGGVLQSTDTAAPYSHAWSVSSSLNGAHSWTAKAYDAAGNSRTSAAVSLTVNISSADTTLPTVSITSPASGTSYTTAQTVAINGSASDNVGVTKVEFYRGGVLQSTDTAAPYSQAWPVSSSLNGTHSWTAKAYDAAGNNKTSVAVSLTVNISAADTTLPTVSITSPASGTSYTTAQTVTVNGSASDNVGVTKVEFYRGGVLQSTDTAAPYSQAWPVSSSLNGTHSWTAKAYDAAGNNKTSVAVSLTVNISAADTTLPTVSITSPASGTSYTTAQTVTVNGSASDNVGVTKVEFYRGGVLQSTDTAAPYSQAWPVSSSLNGTHSWTAKAYDAAGNNKTSVAVSLTVNISAADTTLPTVSITSPASGTSYTTAQTVTVNGSASDNVGVTKVEFYRGGVLQSTDTAAPYSQAWPVSSSLNGTHSWTAKAYDAAGNNKTSVAVSLTVNVPPAASAGTHLWSRAFGGATTADIASGQATAIDPWGDVFVVAMVSGTVNFGAGALTSGGGIVLAQYSADGQITRWSRLWTRQASQVFVPSGMIVNADGSVVVVGYFSGTIDFGGTLLTCLGGYDMFMVKYSDSGQYQWSRRFGAAGSEVPRAMAVDSFGNLFVTGYIQGTATVGGSTLTSVSGSRDAFLAKYSSGGAHVWSKAFGGSTTDEGLGTAVDVGGNPWITGSFEGAVDFGDGPLTSAGLTDVFVAGFSADGTLPNTWRQGGTGRDQGRRTAIDSHGNPILAAHFEGSVNFGGQTLTSAGYVDIALAKYSANGSLQWLRKFGGSNNDSVNALAVNAASDEIAITGTFVSWIDLGGASHFGNGSVDVFIAKYGPDGARLWSKGAGVEWDDYGNGVALDDSGEVVATGSFYKGIDLGGGLMTTVVGSTDTYLARFAR
jgi:hypothetical protein